MAFGDVVQVKAIPILAGTPGSPTPTAFDSNVTTGNRVVVAVSEYNNGSPSSIVGSANVGTFVKDLDPTPLTGPVHLSLWSAPVTGTGPCTVTITAANEVGEFITAFMLELAGPFDATPVEATNSASAAFDDTQVCGSGAVTPAGAAVLVAALTDDQSAGTISAPASSFTERFNDGGGGTHNALAVATRTVTGDGATPFSTSWTNSGSSGSQTGLGGMVAYKGEAGGGPPATPVGEAGNAGGIIRVARPRLTLYQG